MPPDFNLVGVLVAALGGAAVGLEREWSGHADGERARFAGIRTFTLLGTLGGLSGGLWVTGVIGPAIALVAGAAALTVAAYIAGSRHDVDGTTEVAALVVVGAGVLSGIGALQVGSGIIALETLLLAEKSGLHAAVRKIDTVGLRAGIRFSAMALVVLPLLPTGPYGPLGGVRPRELWALVLFFSGLSFVGYGARRLLGAGHGSLVTGLLGGLVSSTNVTFAFARLSRREPSNERALAIGAVGANAMLYPRVLLATTILNPPLVSVLWPYVIGPAVLAAAVTAVGFVGRRPAADSALTFDNPLQLKNALRMAILFQVVLMAVHALRGLWGDAGVMGSAAVLGLTDVDALTITMARSVAQTTSLQVAAAAIAIGILSNSVMKLLIAAFLGSNRFRVVTATTLLLMAVVAAVSLVLLGTDLK